MKRNYIRSSPDPANRPADTHSRAAAPTNRAIPSKRPRGHEFGALADPGRFFIAAQRTGIIHFHV